MVSERRALLKQKLRNRERVFAAWTSIAHPSITEIFARSGVDFIGIDMEHSCTSHGQAQRIIAACNSQGTICLPRIASHNMEMVKRLLDSGADGIIMPMVSMPDDVEQLISWCKYPPSGNRSFGIARGQGYGFDFDEYVEGWNESSLMIVQIESQHGVDNIDDILAYDEIEGVMVGPYDLSGSLGIPGRLNDPKVKKAEKRVIEACEKYGKACGTHFVEAEADDVEEGFSRGYTFVVLASDVFVLWKWSEKQRGIINKLR